jgi:hypothetical protein
VSRGSLLVLVVMVLTALLLWLLPLHLGNMAHSHFRDRLWRVRDNLVDDLLFGRLQPRREAQELLRLIESHIRAAGRHTYLDVRLVLKIYKDEDMLDLTDELLGGDLPVTERQRLAKHLCDFLDACRDHLDRGSLLGLLSYLGWQARRVRGKRAQHDGWQHHDQQLRNQRNQEARIQAIEIPRLYPKRKKRSRDFDILDVLPTR